MTTGLVRTTAVSFALAALASLGLVGFILRPGSYPPVSLLIPVLVTLPPLVVGRGRPGRLLRIAAASLLFAFILLAILSIGWFYLPSALAMTIAAATPQR